MGDVIIVWLLIGDNFASTSPGNIWQYSRDIFVCHNWAECCRSWQWVNRGHDAAKSLTLHKIPPPTTAKNFPVQNINSATVKKNWYKFTMSTTWCICKRLGSPFLYSNNHAKIFLTKGFCALKGWDIEFNGIIIMRDLGFSKMTILLRCSWKKWKIYL